MKKVSKYKIRINKEDHDKAHRLALRSARSNHHTYDRYYVGYLGEMVAAMYLGILWEDPEYAQRDLIDGFGTKYQVKTTREGRDKKRLWCDVNGNGFDRYIFVILDEKDRFGDIECDSLREVAEANSHEFQRRPALLRYCDGS